eukprot:101375-Pelagomonas_calceolata.AAC.2
MPPPKSDCPQEVSLKEQTGGSMPLPISQAKQTRSSMPSIVQTGGRLPLTVLLCILTRHEDTTTTHGTHKMPFQTGVPALLSFITTNISSPWSQLTPSNTHLASQPFSTYIHHPQLSFIDTVSFDSHAHSTLICIVTSAGLSTATLFTHQIPPRP